MNNAQSIRIAPSILAADFAQLGKQVKEASESGADSIHIDVMDGHFVPNISIGSMVVSSLRSWSDLPFEVHMMVSEPEKYIKDFVDAGANIITVHIEASKHIYRTIRYIKQLGVKANIALNPTTHVSSIQEVIPEVNGVLVMTVNPGFGGQPFIKNMTKKISDVSSMISAKSLPTEICVDGGITVENAPQVAKSGARVLVAGSSVFSSENSIFESISNIRSAAHSGIM